MLYPTEKDQALIDYIYANFNNVPRCEEYEQMVSRMEYNLMGELLMTARITLTERCQDYAQIRLANYPLLDAYSDARTEALRGILGKMGEGTYIEPPLAVDYGCNIEVGKSFYANFNLTVLDCALVTIGDHVMFGPNVLLITALHPLETAPRRAGVEMAAPIVIGNDVWLGLNVVVLPGVTIGDGAVVGAGAVVSKDIPPYLLALGLPAKVVRLIAEGGRDDAIAQASNSATQ